MREVLAVLPTSGATVAELTEAIYGPDVPDEAHGRYASWTTRDTHRGAVRRAAYALERRGDVELELLVDQTYRKDDPERPYAHPRPANSLLVRHRKTWTPAGAVATLRWDRDIHGGRARYEPNSDHTVVRLEAWAVATDSRSLSRVETVLAMLRGVLEHGTGTDDPDGRPRAWVLLNGDGSVCTHRSERWHNK